MVRSKRCDAGNRPPARQNRTQHSLIPIGKADTTLRSEINLDRQKVKRLTFAEDFILEHTLSGLNAVGIEISGSSRLASRESQETIQNIAFPS